ERPADHRICAGVDGDCIYGTAWARPRVKPCIQIAVRMNSSEAIAEGSVNDAKGTRQINPLVAINCDGCRPARNVHLKACVERAVTIKPSDAAPWHTPNCEERSCDR